MAPVVTVAVKSTPCPETDGLGVVVRVVIEVLGLTVCEVGVTVLLDEKFAPPLYVAVRA